MNKGQMVSSTGLCSALQREILLSLISITISTSFFIIIGRVSDLNFGQSGPAFHPQAGPDVERAENPKFGLLSSASESTTMRLLFVRHVRKKSV